MEGMHRCNIHILTGDGQITHWTGSPALEGGNLRPVDMSAPGGPPVYEYCGPNDRDQYKFNCDTKIIGATAEEQAAFLAKYALGTVFTDADISGVPTGLDWIVESHHVRHTAEGNTPSILSIVLAEIGPTGS